MEQRGEDLLLAFEGEASQAVAGRDGGLVDAAVVKTLIGLSIIVMIAVWSAVSFRRSRRRLAALQLVGATFLGVVVLTHLFEALHVLTFMRWGSPDSPGHYLDLSSAVLGVILLPLAFMARMLSRQRG